MTTGQPGPVAPTPLRLRSGDDSGPQSPEALLISALLEEGQFVPEKFGVSASELSCYQPLYRFCCEYQERVGWGPAIGLVRQRFPDFELTVDVDPEWAAGELHKAAKTRELRGLLAEANTVLRDGDVVGAYEMFTGLTPPVTGAPPTFDGFEYEGEEELLGKRIEVPFPTLQNITHGIGMGELWYVGARTGMGKTNEACAYTARAVAAGARVVYFSNEMPSRAIRRRVRRVLAAGDTKLLKALDDPSTIEQALRTLRARIPGEFGVLDPSKGLCTVEAVRNAMEGADLIVVDHVGLMTGTGNKQAIDDWRILAAISNGLKQEALRTGVPVLGLAQTNRQSESSDNKRLPKLSELADTDHLGRDADVVVTMTRYSDGVMLHGAQKVREGPSKSRWFSEYDPKRARFAEVTQIKADELAERDNSRSALRPA